MHRVHWPFFSGASQRFVPSPSNYQILTCYTESRSPRHCPHPHRCIQMHITFYLTRSRLLPASPHDPLLHHLPTPYCARHRTSCEPCFETCVPVQWASFWEGHHLAGRPKNLWGASLSWWRSRCCWCYSYCCCCCCCWRVYCGCHSRKRCSSRSSLGNGRGACA